MSEKEEYDFSQAKQDRATAVSPNKTRITIRLDTDILAWFRQRLHDAGGGNYQTLINDALHDHIRQQDGDLERTLRRVIREELAGRRKG